MFGIKKNKRNGDVTAPATLDLDGMAALLKTTPEALEAFNRAYEAHSIAVDDAIDETTDTLHVNSRQASRMTADAHGIAPEARKIADDIVDGLVAATATWSYRQTDDGSVATKVTEALAVNATPTRDEIAVLPRDERPQLTATLTTKDFDEDSAPVLLTCYARYLEARDAGDAERAQTAYHLFRQGLDTLDLDPVAYAIIDTNPNSMGYWLPALADAIETTDSCGLTVPATKIAHVPLTLAQLARVDYASLTPTTKYIVDEWAHRVFGLKSDGDYFIKTGTYSSKFDFRNARVTTPDEVSDLGEYLLYIHHQALQMASPLASPCIYGVSTTNEWVVRDFIADASEPARPTIYHGLPLRCEFRVFVDADEDRVLGIHPYWDPDVMERHFAERAAQGDADAVHDAITYRMAKADLEREYADTRDAVVAEIVRMLPALKLSGQWSLDIMKNGDALVAIDMALAEHSAFYRECVPHELRRPTPEQWLPEIKRA